MEYVYVDVIKPVILLGLFSYPYIITEVDLLVLIMQR